jgi:hypothetical protein
LEARCRRRFFGGGKAGSPSATKLTVWALVAGVMQWVCQGEAMDHNFLITKHLRRDCNQSIAICLNPRVMALPIWQSHWYPVDVAASGDFWRMRANQAKQTAKINQLDSVELQPADRHSP